MPNPYPKPNHNLIVTLPLEPYFDSQKCLQTCGDWDFDLNCVHPDASWEFGDHTSQSAGAGSAQEVAG